MKSLIFIILLLLTTGQTMAQEEPLTLQDAYRMALKQSESLAIQQQKIKEAEGRFVQALSGILPKASFEYTYTYEQGGNREPASRFTFSQPLFSGFKEFAAMAGSKAEGRKLRQEEIRAKQLLFIDVSEAFYYLSLYQQQRGSTQSIISALTERMAELKKRVELGRSRKSEISSAEARLRRSEADLEQIQSDLDVARELLQFLTGTTVVLIKDDLQVNELTMTIDQMQEAASKRADIKAAEEAVNYAAKNIVVARAGYWPTVSADGNYYTKKTTDSGPDWDVGLKVSVPLFQGGEVRGDVAEKTAIYEQAKLSLMETRRKALLEIHQAYARVRSAYRRAEALKKAVDAADQNYQLQSADYLNSMVNNLDVLQSLTDLEDVRKSYISAAVDEKRFDWQLKVALRDLNDVHF